MTAPGLKLLLDAHISGRRIGAKLAQNGFDVVSADSTTELEGLSDDRLLEIAAAEERVLVTFDVKDFARIVRSWAEVGKAHSGCVIVTGLNHAEFGSIIRVLERAFSERPEPSDWNNRTVFLTRAHDR